MYLQKKFLKKKSFIREHSLVEHSAYQFIKVLPESANSFLFTIYVVLLLVNELCNFWTAKEIKMYRKCQSCVIKEGLKCPFWWEKVRGDNLIQNPERKTNLLYSRWNGLSLGKFYGDYKSFLFVSSINQWDIAV